MSDVMTTWSRIVDRWRLVPTLAMVSAVALLVAGVLIAFYSEQLYEAQKAREISVQARILAASVTGALAFDDPGAARENANALGANPEIEAAGVYDQHGELVAQFRRRGAPPPAHVSATAPVLTRDYIAVTSPVIQRNARLGTVYLRATAEPTARRVTRFGGIGLLLTMACLVLAVLAAAHAAMRRANAELQNRARDLEDVNRRLQVQMAEREKAEEALRQSQKMEAIGQLTGGVAHDFNNLLMVASSGMDLLDRTQDPVRRARLRDGVRQALDRGAALTRQLLAFSRPTALKPEVIDLGGQIEGMRMLLDGSLREDIKVEIEIEPDLWPVQVDPSQLELAVVNVAVNARDAMPNGGAIRIVARNAPTSAEGGRDTVRLEISDTGEGMSPDTIARVFEPFFTTKDVGRGTGLGLSQVYGFAQASGGQVRIDSRLGEGATVSLLLPRSNKPLRRAEEVSAEGRGPRGDGLILLVEDDDAVAISVEEMLRELGYDVVRADSAAAALAILGERTGFRLVFSDMVMPGEMDGAQLAREIGQRWPQLPVVLTTGFSEAAAQAAGDGLRLVLKPYKIEVLAREMAAALADPPRTA